MRTGSPSSSGSQSEEGSSSSDHQQPQQEAQEQEQQLHTPTHAHAAVPAATSEEILAEYGSNLKLLECNSQVAELLTILRDK